MIITIDKHQVQIDEEDYALVYSYKWHYTTLGNNRESGYFTSQTRRTNGIRHSVFLHRVIMGCTHRDGSIVDHINHDTFDNRKCNLRITTSAGNRRNSRKPKSNKSGYKGVHFRPEYNIYSVNIRCGGSTLCVGQTSTAVEGAKLYDKIALKLHGEYACLNFDKSDYSEEEIDKAYADMRSIKPITNSSGYLGVSFNQVNKTWIAAIIHDKHKYYLGSFHSPEEAARVRDAKAKELLGDKAKLNFE